MNCRLLANLGGHQAASFLTLTTPMPWLDLATGEAGLGRDTTGDTLGHEREQPHDSPVLAPREAGGNGRMNVGNDWRGSIVKLDS